MNKTTDWPQSQGAIAHPPQRHEPHFSLFSNITSNDPVRYISETELLHWLRADADTIAKQEVILGHYDRMEAGEESKGPYQDKKTALLAAVAPWGEVENKAAKRTALGKPAGIVCVDVDRYKPNSPGGLANTPEELRTFFTGISALPYARIAHRSVSGLRNGSLAVYVSIETPDDLNDTPKGLHKRLAGKVRKGLSDEALRVELHSKLQTAYQSLVAYKLETLGIYIGDTGKSPVNSRYINHDPEPYYNPDAQPITLAELEQSWEVVESWEAAKLAAKIAARKAERGDKGEQHEHSGNAITATGWQAACIEDAEKKGKDFAECRHDYIFALADYANALGVPLEVFEPWVRGVEGGLVGAYLDENGRSHITYTYEHYKEKHGVLSHLLGIWARAEAMALAPLAADRTTQATADFYLADGGTVVLTHSAALERLLGELGTPALCSPGYEMHGGGEVRYHTAEGGGRVPVLCPVTRAALEHRDMIEQIGRVVFLYYTEGMDGTAAQRAQFALDTCRLAKAWHALDNPLRLVPLQVAATDAPGAQAMRFGDVGRSFALGIEPDGVRTSKPLTAGGYVAEAWAWWGDFEKHGAFDDHKAKAAFERWPTRPEYSVTQTGITGRYVSDYFRGRWSDMFSYVVSAQTGAGKSTLVTDMALAGIPVVLVVPLVETLKSMGIEATDKAAIEKAAIEKAEAERAAVEKAVADLREAAQGQALTVGAYYEHDKEIKGAGLIVTTYDSLPGLAAVIPGGAGSWIVAPDEFHNHVTASSLDYKLFTMSRAWAAKELFGNWFGLTGTYLHVHTTDKNNTWHGVRVLEHNAPLRPVDLETWRADKPDGAALSRARAEVAQGRKVVILLDHKNKGAKIQEKLAATGIEAVLFNADTKAEPHHIAMLQERRLQAAVTVATRIFCEGFNFMDTDATLIAVGGWETDALWQAANRFRSEAPDMVWYLGLLKEERGGGVTYTEAQQRIEQESKGAVAEVADAEKYKRTMKGRKRANGDICVTYMLDADGNRFEVATLEIAHKAYKEAGVALRADTPRLLWALARQGFVVSEEVQLKFGEEGLTVEREDKSQDVPRVLAILDLLGEQEVLKMAAYIDPVTNEHKRPEAAAVLAEELLWKYCEAMGGGMDNAVKILLEQAELRGFGTMAALAKQSARIDYAMGMDDHKKKKGAAKGDAKEYAVLVEFVLAWKRAGNAPRTRGQIRAALVAKGWPKPSISVDEAFRVVSLYVVLEGKKPDLATRRKAKSKEWLYTITEVLSAKALGAVPLPVPALACGVGFDWD